MSKQILSTEKISKMLFSPSSSEQEYNSENFSKNNGIFIGMSKSLSKHFFINFDYLVNPHMFVVGMTGSGKTYLVKNISIKLYGYLSATVLIIDFTGEYKEFAEFVNAAGYNPDFITEKEEDSTSRICYISFENFTEDEKIQKGKDFILNLVELMRKRELSGMQRLFIIIDEAWKLLGKNSGIETIIREGRKYTTGIILASQLLEDIKSNSLSNVASIFVFRNQNIEEVEKLATNYEIETKYIQSIQNLDVGSCIVIQVYKSGKRSVFQIKRVIGVNVDLIIKILIGEKMVEIKQSSLENMIKNISNDDPSYLISYIRSQKSIELIYLIKELIRLNSDRIKILSYLRLFKISENDIADSFAAAIEVVTYEIE